MNRNLYCDNKYVESIGYDNKNNFIIVMNKISMWKEVKTNSNNEYVYNENNNTISYDINIFENAPSYLSMKAL